MDYWTEKEQIRSEDAWNNCSIELASASLAHVRYFVMRTFAANLTSGLNSISTPLKSILLDLFKTLAFTWMKENFGDFFILLIPLCQNGYAQVQRYPNLFHKIFLE